VTAMAATQHYDFGGLISRRTGPWRPVVAFRSGLAIELEQASERSASEQYACTEVHLEQFSHVRSQDDDSGAIAGGYELPMTTVNMSNPREDPQIHTHHRRPSANPEKNSAKPCAPGSGTSSNPLPPIYTVRPKLAFIPFVFLLPCSAACAAF